jgi:hypothetical protein
MFGQSVGRAMTKEDHLQVMNANKFLVPMKTVRELQSMAVPVALDTSLDPQCNTHFNMQEYKIRLEQQENDKKMQEQFIQNTIRGAIDARKKILNHSRK